MRLRVPGLVNYQIEELQHQLEELQQNNNPCNLVVKDLLEETESPFCEDIRMAIMLDRLKLLDVKYNGIGDPTEHSKPTRVGWSLTRHKCVQVSRLHDQFYRHRPMLVQDSTLKVNPKLSLAFRVFCFIVRCE